MLGSYSIQLQALKSVESNTSMLQTETTTIRGLSLMALDIFLANRFLNWLWQRVPSRRCGFDNSEANSTCGTILAHGGTSSRHDFLRSGL